MDTQNLFYAGSRGTFTPRTRQSSASSIVSGRKPLNSFKKGISSGSRYSISGRSTQSTQIIARTENNIVESYGLPLPVLVNEALTFYDRNAVVSINCSPHGWAWAVCGRRLLVWQYKESNQNSPKTDTIRTPNRRTASGQCRELTLPHCDIGHKASLITVFLADGQQMASCLAISPTGDVRYWPSIAHDGSSIDETGILEGQEFDELQNISPVLYALATTTCNLILLQLQLTGGRHAIVHRAIKPPTGFLGGIGKKFASIIIGINSNHDKEHKFIQICAEKQRNSDSIVSVLSDRWIQRWLITVNGHETFLYEDFEIYRKIRDVFHQKLWNNRDPNEIDIKFLAMQPCGSKLVILVAAINETHTPQIHYALITMAEEGQMLTLSNYSHINYNSFLLTNTISMDNLKMNFILNRGVAYVYDHKTIYQIYTNEMGCEETENIEFPSQEDKIMTAAIHNNIPLFFSRLYGLVCISPADMEAGEYFNNSIASEMYNDTSFLSQSSHFHNDSEANLTLYQLNPEDVYNTDLVSQMKAAFIYHLKKNTTKSHAILTELFDNDEQQMDLKLDGIIVHIARDLAEDVPAADPRWDQTMANKHALGSSASMQIIQQLREKNLAYNHFINFLQATDLWHKLSVISDRLSAKSTCHILADINEQIIAAISLKKIHSTYSQLIDDAIQVVLKNRNEQLSGNLSPQDLFYVKVTKIQDIFKVLANVGDEIIQNEQLASQQTSSTLLDVVSVILNVLTDVIKFRESKMSQYKLPTHKLSQYEYLPWTAASGKHGLRDTLLHLISVTLKYGARSTGEPELRQKHYKQLVDLIDFVLDGRKNYLESIKDTDKYGVMLQQYESQRADLILPLVIDGQYELAAKLAEKYLDFQILVQICDRTENQVRLDEYIEKYKEMDFSQFAINWHLKQNKQGDLFERFKRNQAELSKFLGDHPSLAWIQAVFNGNFLHASKILFALAQNETELIARKKTMLSLAKLASLSVDDDLSVQIAHINSELALVAYQENLPIQLLAAFGYETDNPNVLKAEEIINLLIARENESATECDYRKALELLQYVEDAIDVRHKIWCSAILRDTWTTYNPNSPLEDLQNTMLFKLIDLCFFLDAEIDDFLPPIEDFLEAPELESLTTDKSFQFLLKLGYEHIFETYKQGK